MVLDLQPADRLVVGIGETLGDNPFEVVGQRQIEELAPFADDGRLYYRMAAERAIERAAIAETRMQLQRLARATDEVNVQMAARSAMGIALYYQGHFDDAREHLTIQQESLRFQFEEAGLDWRTTTLASLIARSS